jgi:CheY-like chemotaxis protein
VVEDDQHVREVVAGMLSTLGYQVASCENGADALEQCDKVKFDLVLADMIMPKMNGSELVGLLKQRQQDTKTLIMTAYGVTQDALGDSTRIIAKPFDIDTLAQTIRELLDGEQGEAAEQR